MSRWYLTALTTWSLMRHRGWSQLLSNWSTVCLWSLVEVVWQWSRTEITLLSTSTWSRIARRPTWLTACHSDTWDHDLIYRCAVAFTDTPVRRSAFNNIKSCVIFFHSGPTPRRLNLNRKHFYACHINPTWMHYDYIYHTATLTI